MAGRVGGITPIPMGGYGFCLLDEKNSGGIYLTYETHAQAEEARKLAVQAFAKAKRAICA
jgi:hypothetical protein